MNHEERCRRINNAAVQSRAHLKRVLDQDPQKATSEEVAKAIFTWEQHELHSKFFLNGEQPYMLDGISGDVFPMDLRSSDFAAWLSIRYGFIKGQRKTGPLAQLLHDRVHRYSPNVTVHRFSYYDVETHCLYIDANDGQVWKLDGQEPPHLVPNGSSGVIFRHFRGKDIPTSEAKVGPHGILHPMLVDDLHYGEAPLLQKHRFGAWIHALAFNNVMANARPILMVNGAPNSGKTTAVKRVNMMLTGNERPILLKENGEDDFPIQLLHRNPVCHIDNQDRSLPWLPDAVAGYATGAGWGKKKLYYDDEMHDMMPTSFLAISSADPASFRRADVTQRLVVLTLEPYSRGEGGDSDELIRTVRLNRDRLYGEWLHTVNAMVSRYPTVNLGDEGPSSRMVSWGKLCNTYLGALGLEESEDEQAAARQTQIDFSAEEDPAVDIVDRWLESRANKDKWLKASELYLALREKSGASPGVETSFTRTYKHEVPFGKWLKNEGREKLASKGFVLTSKTAEGGKSLVWNIRSVGDDE